MIRIKSLTISQLQEALLSRGVEGYRFDQVFKWLYQKGVGSFDEMTNLSQSLRKQLSDDFDIETLHLEDVQVSSDGTQKFLFELSDHHYVETVLIPNGPRQTLCISTQVGCAMACSFCLTGSLGLKRNLRHDEIVEQVLAVKRAVGKDSEVTNVVYMGMGEPMHNLDHVLESLLILQDERGPKIGKNKITVSTCGLVPQMLEFGKRSDVKLAVSLTATTDEVRNQLIPINRKYPIQVLMDACRQYPLRKGGRITFEYTLLKGVNDSMEDAKRLCALLSRVSAKLNLISYNACPGSKYEASSMERMLEFQDYMLRRNLQTNIRHSRGGDILGACGQLGITMQPKDSSVEPPA